MNRHSELLAASMGFFAPIVILVGLYITINGHMTPGGGFQGGAVLSTIFIVRYLSRGRDQTNLAPIQLAEKGVLLFILLIPPFIGLSYLGQGGAYLTLPYMILMNTLIALKVACGCTILFVRFIHYEVR